MLQLVRAFGLLFVAAIGFCLVVPVVRGACRKSPPALATHVYTIITVGGLLLGISLLSFKELGGSIEQYLSNVFKDGMIAGRLNLVLLAVYLSLTFILGNMTRSYYNLHRIEEDESFPLGRLIASLTKWSKFVEAVLRLGMLITVLLLTNSIHRIYSETPNSGSLLNVEAFRIQFDSFWHLAQAYYVLLLLWDLLIWITNRGSNDAGLRAEIAKTLKGQALPVHFAGLFISLLMCLPRHSTYLSQFVDIAGVFSLIAALGGCVFLAVSVVGESEWVRPKQGVAAAEMARPR